MQTAVVSTDREFRERGTVIALMYWAPKIGPSRGSGARAGDRPPRGLAEHAHAWRATPRRSGEEERGGGQHHRGRGRVHAIGGGLRAVVPQHGDGVAEGDDAGRQHEPAQ